MMDRLSFRLLPYSVCALGLIAALTVAGCGDDPAVQANGTNNGGGPNNDGAENNAQNNGANNGGGNNGANNGGGDPLALPECVAADEVCDGADNDCDGDVDEGLGCACVEDDACYGGPPAARGVGACTDGTRMCDGTGEFFLADCQDWVGPIQEECGDGIDNDCDGIVDEGACVEVCQPGDVRDCYDGPEEQAGVGFCTEGSQLCDEERRWGPCEGWVAANPTETCDNNIDDDCDGIVDVDCYDDEPEHEDRFDVTATESRQPVDFIMAIDNSGSMRDTVNQVEGNLGALATRMVDSGIDYRFILVSERGTGSSPDVCVPQPMAGPNCSNNDRFIHLNREVGSHSAFSDLLACYNNCAGNREYRSFLREGSLKQMIVVTDDESNMGWPQFRDATEANLGPFLLNGVVGLRNGGCVADVGNQYISGANETGGELLHICDNDWGVVIDVLFEATITRLTASFVLSQTPVPETIRVFITQPNQPELEQVGNWSYDQASNSLVFDQNSAVPDGWTVIARYKIRG
jgi:hypothetical protein